MISAGHSTAVARADSYFSATSKYIDEVNGITFYDCVSDYADNFDDKYEELVEKINRVKEILFHKDNLMVDFTGSKDGFKFIYEKAAEFKNNLSQKEQLLRKSWDIPNIYPNEQYHIDDYIPRYTVLADWFISILVLENVKVVAMEDYALGAQ